MSPVSCHHLQSGEGVQFTRTHHVVRKTTLYDMDVEPSWKYTAIGCQDRNIRWVTLPSQTSLQIHFHFVYFVGRGVSMWDSGLLSGEVCLLPGHGSWRSDLAISPAAFTLGAILLASSCQTLGSHSFVQLSPQSCYFVQAFKPL